MFEVKKILVILILIFFGANSSIAQSKKELKNQKKIEEYDATKKLVESGKFIFHVNWAISQDGDRTQLSGTGLMIEDGRTSASLLFSGGTHRTEIGRTNIGIQFNTTKTKFDIEFDDLKRRIFVNFQATHKAERYKVYLTIQGNGKTNVKVSSSIRDTMSYEGIIKKVSLNDI